MLDKQIIDYNLCFYSFDHTGLFIVLIGFWWVHVKDLLIGKENHFSGFHGEA